MNNFVLKTNKSLIILLVLLLTACASKHLSYKNITPITVTDNIAGKYALYAMMASNSYHKDDRVRFPLEKINWKRVTIAGVETEEPSADHPFTGLAYDIFEKTDSIDVVFAFRGSDSLWDYFMANFALCISPTYKQAFKEFKKYKDSHPEKKIIVTGHSLGGGIALGVSVRFGIDAIVFDASPRIFDGLRDNHKYASRILIYQDSELLNKVRMKWKKISEVIKEGDVYKTNYNFKGKSNHRADLLAKGLLDQGKASNSELQIVAENL